MQNPNLTLRLSMMEKTAPFPVLLCQLTCRRIGGNMGRVEGKSLNLEQVSLPEGSGRVLDRDNHCVPDSPKTTINRSAVHRMI